MLTGKREARRLVTIPVLMMFALGIGALITLITAVELVVAEVYTGPFKKALVSKNVLTCTTTLWLTLFGWISGIIADRPVCCFGAPIGWTVAIHGRQVIKLGESFI